MTHYPQDPQEAPDWAFGPDVGITCPLDGCGEHLFGLNWKLTEVYASEVQFEQDKAPKTETPEVKATAMILVPCGHELPTDVWELSFSGRDRALGTIIRTPKFQRLDGS